MNGVMSASVPRQRRPKVAVIGLGGTFAMQARHEFDWIEYSESGVVHSIDDLIARMGPLAPDIDTVPMPFRALGSTSIVPRDWSALAALIRRAASADPDIDAFVVTHGTATMEETAWFLALTTPAEKPVVITGAQRPFNVAGSDAPGNLRAALAVAVSPGARHAGALVVMDGWVFGARDVSKVASFELGAFESPGFGPLARVEPDGKVSWRRRSCHEPAGSCTASVDGGVRFDVDENTDLPRVDIVMSYAGADGVVINALAAAGSRGLVSAGLAPGRPASGEMSAYRAAVERGVVVVQATRAARGYVPLQDFMTRDGLLAGGDLSPQKLRILLMLALTETRDPEKLQQILLET
jgi:L-asparaginase